MTNWRTRQWLLCGALGMLMMLTGSFFPAGARADNVNLASASEADLKAVYLYNFLRFVRWPQEGRTSLDKTRPKKIAVVGDCLCTDALRRLQAKLVEAGQTPVTVVFHGAYREGMNLCDCNLLYICKPDAGRLAKILESLGDAPVLTVGDGEAFVKAGGMVALVNHKNTVRWSINRLPLARSGLRLSAKLYEIAINVIDDHNSSMERYYHWLARLATGPEAGLAETAPMLVPEPCLAGRRVRKGDMYV